MQDSIAAYFLLGFIPSMAYPQARKDDQLLRVLERLAADEAFEAIETGYTASEATVARIRQIAERSGVTVCYAAQSALMSNGLNANALDEGERLRAEAMLLQCADQAERMGARRMVFLAGHYAEEEKEAAFAQLCKTVKNVCRYARAKGILVELELFDYDIAKKSLIGPAALAARMAQEVRASCDNFGLLLDLSHIPMLYDHARNVVRILRPYITHFHIGNTVCGDPAHEGYGDEHQRFGFPHSANDTPQLLDFLRVLRQEGYFVRDNPFILSFEVKPWKEENGDLIVANAKRALHRAWCML